MLHPFRYGAEQVPEGDVRTISNLLLDQIEFADGRQLDDCMIGIVMCICM